MYQIQQISDSARQNQTLTLPDGTQINISMYYSNLQQGWFFSNITYGTFVLNGLRITVNPNMLYQWKNILPFGINCFSDSTTREPSQQEDFSSGLFKMYVLSAAEVAEYTAYLTNSI
jgi:hypothetical protein